MLGYRANQQAADALAAELDSATHPVVVQRCDVSDPADVSALFDVAEQLGEVGLVNSAGILETQCRVEQIDAERWQRVCRPM